MNPNSIQKTPKNVQKKAKNAKIKKNMKSFLKPFSFILLFFLQTFSFAQDKAKPSSRPIVDMLCASAVSTDKIRLTWKLPQNFNAVSILVFKDTVPVNSKSVEKLSPIAELSQKTQQYIDTVTDFNEYYYAVLAKLSDGTLYNVVLPSINATVKAVAVKRPEKARKKSEEQIAAETPKLYTDGTIRELPLPYIDLIGDFEKKPSKLSAEVVNAGKSLAGKTSIQKEKLEPYYFDEDITSPSGGDDYYLFEILKNSFVKKNYEASIIELKKFLSVNRSEETTNRAAFYLAQSQYFTGNYRSALTMFLFTQDTWPILCKKWINSTLDFYTIPKS